MREQDRHRAVGVGERRAAGEQLEGDAAERVEVAPRPGQPAHGLLGGDVVGRADRRARGGEPRGAARAIERLGDAEVGDLDPAVGGDEQVLRLEVAVHDPEALGMREAGEDVEQHAGRLLRRQRRLVAPQRPARHELHGDERNPVVLEEVVHRDEVRVRERPGKTGLAQEPLGRRPVPARAAPTAA